MLARQSIPKGPDFPNLLHDEISLKPGVLFDMPLRSQFGEVFTDAHEHYYTGSRVKVRFAGANPRNDLRLEGTYLKVERLTDEAKQQWQVVAVDGNWETM